MPSITDYTALTKVVLLETGKYFALLLFSVLAIRLWRHWLHASAANKPKSLLLASAASLLAGGLGCASICHSMSLMYSYFGMKAFHSYKIDSALVLFHDSLGFWKNADALGGKGVCLLWLGDPPEGIRLLHEAKAMRRGKGSSFENFYGGLYYFYHNDATNAIPLLEAASGDPDFQWNVTKLFAALQLDWNRPQEAARLMQPFLQAEVTDADQAYIVASLKWAEGKTNEAKALVDKFATPDLPPFWKTRFENLRTQLPK